MAIAYTSCYHFGFLIPNKMELNKTKHYIEITFNDENGFNLIRIQKDCTQLQIENDNGDSYVDLNYRQLKQIRDSISEVLDGFAQAE